MPRRESWDVFCTVVDNFGDIGVTWRLVRQLIGEQGRKVTLWVDDLDSFARIEPAVDPSLQYQQIGGANIRKWYAAFPDVEPADVVVEAFACHLPEKYVTRMAQSTRRPAWINLEYLCAEKWIEDTHALPSLHPRLPLTKYFFFPGFTERTGGLLREQDLLQRRDALQSDAAALDALWMSLGAPPRGEDLRVSLFCYRNAGLPSLLDEWVSGNTRIMCFMPEGPALGQINDYFGSVGTHFHRGNLELRILPFVQQDDYDRLLWACDINFVRGEDSFLRAQWAGRPFIWQIYPQDDEAHWPKMEAFLDLYCGALDASSLARVKFAWHHWNRGQDMRSPWNDLVAGRAGLDPHAVAWSHKLAGRPDLATQLAEFADKLL